MLVRPGFLILLSIHTGYILYGSASLCLFDKLKVVTLLYNVRHK